MATTQQGLPPGFQIVKSGNQILQATDAMAGWMRLITKQAADAMAALPTGTVTHSGDTLPDNAVILGTGSSDVSSVPPPVVDPGVPAEDQVLVTTSPGQAPRWIRVSDLAVRPQAAWFTPWTTADAKQGPLPPPLTQEQSDIINHIIFLLHELVRVTTTRPQ